MKLLFLFVQFFKIGLFSIGGGYATLPFLYEMADKYDWLSAEKIGDMLAVAQSLPGAIGVSLSAYTGFQYAGIPGGLISALGLISPSIIIIIIVARILNAFKENKVVDSLFSGFRPAGAGLLSAAALGALAISLYNPTAEAWTAMFRWRECILFAVIFLLIKLLKKHPIVYIAAAGVIGIVLGL
ncbi:chromate transporter [Treponema primitia]|uniref:chromate transporter n=1 Tax=Treponema primitia TaxID=88058 RepID=UPI00397F49AE